MTAEEIRVREYLERIINERDRLYTIRFEDSRDAVTTALAAQKELTAAAFATSEKAILKAEQAQRDYNVVHNDLTRKMDAQYKEMIPRAEAEALEKSMDAKLLVMQASYDKRIDVLVKETNDLRDMLSKMTGKSDGITTLGASLIAILGFAVSVGVTVLLHYTK